MWLNGKRKEKGLDHKKFREITIKYHSYHRKHGNELVTERKKQCNIIFIDDKSE